MTMFVIQSALLLAVALIIGCAVGYVLRMLIAPSTSATGNRGKAQTTETGERIASVPPAEALTGAPIPPPTRILDETKDIKDRGGRKSPAAKPQTAKSRTAATRTRTAARKKAAASPTPKKKAAASKPAPEKDQGRPRSIVKPARPDSLTEISGIGPTIAGKLNALGIYRWSQIAGWKKAERDWVNAHLSFKGRIEREDWIKQAKALAKGKSGN